LYTLLGSPPHRNDIDWKQVHVFWADERCVPEYHEESNFKLAVDALLSRVAIPRENIHRIKGEDGPECAAEEYDRELRFFFGTIEFPVFDLVLLGAGDDGHTASLFPGSPALRERTRLAVAVHLEAPKPGRVTLPDMERRELCAQFLKTGTRSITPPAWCSRCGAALPGLLTNKPPVY
jgi:6-phosphogluconolactonase